MTEIHPKASKYGDKYATISYRRPPPYDIGLTLMDKNSLKPTDCLVMVVNNQ